MFPRMHARSHTSRTLRWRFAVAILLALAPLLSSIDRASASHQFLWWDDTGTTFATFGPNEAITIDTGAIEFIGHCEEGTNDFIFPFADIYVVPSGSVSEDGDTLTDVSNPEHVPNTVSGASGGLFVLETIGFTIPGGRIDTGTYAVVYDECQSGKFDEANDFLLDPAFEVIIPVELPAIDFAIDGIKQEATQQADFWLRALRGHAAFFTAAEIGELILEPFAVFANETFALLYGRLTGVHLVKPQLVALTTMLNTAKHYAGIHADPPDPDFLQLTPLGVRQLIDPESNDPLLVAGAGGVGNVLGTEAALAEALLISIERYQGAADASNGRWGLIHARAIQAYADALANQLAVTNAALSSLHAAIAADPRDLDSALAELETFRRRLASSGFTADELRLLQNLGLSDDEIDDLQAEIAARDFDFTRADFQSVISDLIATNTAAITSYEALVTDMEDIKTTLLADPFVFQPAPLANAGGPYAVDEGALLTLDGTGSSDPDGSIVAYQWDLDRDGAFDDAAGPSPVVAFNQAFDGLIGLRVTDNDGRLGIGYARVSVANTNSPPFIDTFTPTDLLPEVEVGGTVSFTVTTSDPDGDLVSSEWSVDGVVAATGASFDFQPSDPAEVGMRIIRVVASDDSPLGGSVAIEWGVSVLMPDGDGDGWRANVDCNDSDPNVNPGQTEILFNGKDDDCNPATLDTGGFLQLTSDRILGHNEVITVSGEVRPIPLCRSMGIFGKGRGEGPSDSPTADLYIIDDTGQVLGDLAKLEDVRGAPNRVTAIFVDEPVAVTQPTGNLPEGRYDIVMDQCEDGHFDPDIDILLGDGPSLAFEVRFPLDGIVLPINLRPLKESAKNYSSALKGNPVEIPSFCSGFERWKDGANLVGGSALDRWATLAIANCGDLAQDWEGIARDPADPNFTEFAELGPIPYDFGPAETPLERATERLANTLAEQTAITEAFMVTLERFQGAVEANDHEFMMLQLEHLNKFINLLFGPGGNLLRFYAALEAFDLALREDPLGASPEADEVRAFIPEMRRSIAGLIIPLGSRFKRPDPTDPDKLVPFGLQAWITVYLGSDPFLPGLGLPGIPQLREAQGLPPIAFQHPTARSTGAYTGPPERPIQFDAGPSEDPNGDPLAFVWDLDADGDFNDGNAAIVDRAFDQPGTRLIGLKATDPSGNSDVHYVLLKIGDLTTQDIVVLFDDGRAASFGGARDLLRVSPEGVVSSIQEKVPLPPRNYKTLQVDLNGDIFVLRDDAIFHFNPDGVLIDTITPEQVGDLIGVPINTTTSSQATFSDMVLDGRGDIILAAFKEDSGADPFPTTGYVPPILIRLATNGTKGSIIADDFNLGPFRPSVAIDPNGNIVIGGMADPDVDIGTTTIRGLGGVLVVDPADGSVEEVIPATNAILPDGKFQFVTYLFGGVDLGQAGNDALGDRVQGGGIAVDAQGNYIGANGGTIRGLGLYRVPIPPQLSVLVDNPTRLSLGLEIFPLHFRLAGGDQLFFSDVEIDRGGDYLVAARNLGPGQNFNRHGVYRISPVGETFLVADLRPHTASDPDAPALAVVPEVREVTAKDIPTPPLVPQLQLASLKVNQEACPSAAEVGVTLTNTGTGAVEHPVRVYFFDADPLAGGAAIGTAVAEPPIEPGASVGLSIDWPDPGAGVHQVFAMALGTNSPFAAFMVCIPEPPPDPILLEPAAATNPVGTAHTVTATVTDLLGNPIPGLPITFDVTGANTSTGEATTDADGMATVTYTGTTLGGDAIVASSFGATSNSAVKVWGGPANRPPVADADGPYAGDEGSPITLNASGSSDPDDNIAFYEWDLDKDGEYDDATGITTTVEFDDNGFFVVGLRVTDDLGESDTNTAEVTINNVAATVDAGADQTVNEGDVVSLDPATFSDPGRRDTHTATIDWGDGTPVEPGTVTQTAGSGTVSGSHTYTDHGTYRGTVCVTDDEDGTGCDTLLVTVQAAAPAWWQRQWSAHFGTAKPLGSFDGPVDRGFTTDVDLHIPIRDRLVGEIRFSFTDFGAGTVDTFDLLSLTLGAKYGIVQSGAWVTFVGGGLGAYYLVDPKELDGGGMVGAGIAYRATQRITLELSGEYHRVTTMTPDLEFRTLRLGVLGAF